jgi:hypothetical protein
MNNWIKETFKDLIWVFEGNKLLTIALIFLFFFLVAILFKDGNKQQKMNDKIKADSIKLIEIDENIHEIERSSANIIWRDSVLRANGIKRK